MKEQPITSWFIFGSFWNSLKCILLLFLRLSPTASTRRVCAGTYGSRAAVREGPAAPLPTRRRSWRSENTHSFPFTHIHTIMMTISSQSRAVMHKRAPPCLPTSPVPHSFQAHPHDPSNTTARFTEHWHDCGRIRRHPISSPPLSRSLRIFLSLSGTEWGIEKPVGRWGPSRQFQWLFPKPAPKEQSQGQRWRTTRKTPQRTHLPLSSSLEEETTRRTKRSPVVWTDCLLPASNSKCASLLLELIWTNS